MTTDDAHRSPLCQRVWDRLVQGADVSGDAELGEHLRSCIDCYRALSELRDVPRIAAMLRADAAATARQAQVQVQMDDGFWDQLAARTGDAAAAAMARSGRRRPLRVAVVGVVLAAAAAWMLFLRTPASTTNGVSAGVTGAGVAVVEEGPTEEVDVADVAGLDETALRTLLERLRAGAGEAGALAATDGADEADVFDDDSELDEVLAELDGPALRRVQRSLAGTTL